MSAATVKKNRESTLKGARWWKEVGWRHIVAILMIIYCLVPLLYVLSVSLNPGATLTGSNQLFSKVSFENFAALGSGQYSAYWSWVLTPSSCQPRPLWAPSSWVLLPPTRSAASASRGVARP